MAQKATRILHGLHGSTLHSCRACKQKYECLLVYLFDTSVARFLKFRSKRRAMLPHRYESVKRFRNSIWLVQNSTSSLHISLH